MKFPREILESIVHNTRLDLKGKNLYGTCPYCNGDEFGISLEDNHLFRCFRGKHCGETGNIFKLLKDTGNTQLLKDRDYFKDTNIFNKLERRYLNEQSSNLSVDLPSIHPPLGWRRKYSSKYLESRGFTEVQFHKYEVGATLLDKKYKGFEIFLIRQRSNIVGYIGRNTLSKETIDARNRVVKEKNKSLHDEFKLPVILRYKNSTDTEFSHILYGSDEIIVGVTHTILIVEGLFDKINLEIIAPELFIDSEVVVCCSWGKKLSDIQINSIKDTGVGTVILLYDPDAIKETKDYSHQLSYYFTTVLVSYHPTKDPGELNTEEFLDILDNSYTPTNFYLNKLEKKSFF